MRTLAIGDIHGCARALRALEASVPFRPSDTIVVLGDFVDRGPETRGVIEWMLEVDRRGKLVALRGNHEVMMLRAREDPVTRREWIESGGGAALASYGGGVGLDEIPESHWGLIEATRGWYETGGHFFVHANAYPDLPLEDQPDHMLYWEKFHDPPPHESGKVMVCGHTPQKTGRPRSIGHAVCLDTAACRGGWLTCLNVDSGVYWQASQAGETRVAILEEMDG